MSHGSEPNPLGAVDAAVAQRVAQTLQALAAPSRVQILARLATDGPTAVSELAAAVGMEASAVSHQLRVLRHLGLVRGHRDGRRVSYALFDDHVARFLSEAVGHVEHLRHADAAAGDARTKVTSARVASDR